MPTSLDELLQWVTTTRDGDQQNAVLAQFAEQLRNAAEILERARNHAHWRQLPEPTWEWLRAATDSTRELADGLDDIHPAFRNRPSPSAEPKSHVAAPAPASPASAAERHRCPEATAHLPRKTPSC